MSLMDRSLPDIADCAGSAIGEKNPPEVGIIANSPALTAFKGQTPRGPEV